ncbi:MAG: hypothetical protein PHF86_02305 [Candidatus Nanoarchaeia archaeon]|nr:hypothetical protein [Candidatus Nanoarchaeia archaeon]
MKIIKESLISFERNKDDKYSSLDIGKEYLLKRKSDEIEWNWYPKPEYKEKIIDIISYPKEDNPNLLIKISKININNKNKKTFIAVHNVKRPYKSYESIAYNTLEEALKEEKEYWDLYYNNKIMKDR